MPSARNRRIALIALLAVAGSAGAWLVRARAPSAPSSAGSAPAPERSPAERLAMLENSLRAVEDGVREAPRDRWDPAYVVAQVGRSPDSLRGWVRENTAWIPYRGVLRGPVGVLMDRQGNSLDRSLLLAALLTEAGHAARLARAVLPAERATELLPGLVARRSSMALHESASMGTDTAPVSEFAARYELDGSDIERVLDGYETGTTRLLAQLDERVPEQATQLLSSLSAPDPATEWRARHDTALAALQDHWWVQVREGESWIDLDLLDSSSGAAGTSSAVAMETVGEPEIPASLFHSIAIRVIEERLAGGMLTELRTLDHILRPSELIGRPVVLQFWPTAWPKREPPTEDPGPSTRRLALEQEEWSAALAIGSDVVASAKVAASADAGERTPGWTGLGGAIASGLGAKDQSGQREPDSLLTAVWIEYRIDVPGREPHVLRRRVFDLIGPAIRKAWSPTRTVALDEGQRLTRSLSLMMRTEILPVVSQLAPEYVLHLHGRSLLTNADLIRGVSRESFGKDQHAADSLVRLAEPGVSPLYTLSVLRHDALGRTGFVDRPAILTRHQYPKAKGEGVGLEDATDLVANEIGIALTEADGFAARLEQGVWDTNLEALLAGSRASANTALAYAATDGWRTLTATQGQRNPSGLGADAAALLRQDLERGYTVVAPDAPVVLQGEEFAGWWRIDPATGDALGIAGTGWGQAAPGYAIHIGTVVEIAKPFVFTYALCQYIPQAANSLNVLRDAFWPDELIPYWTAPEAGKDFEDVAVENNRRCVIDAILAGFVATAPLLLRTMTQRQSVLAAELRASRVGPGAFRTRPSMRRTPGIRLRNPSRAAPTPSRGPAGTLPSGRRPPANPLGNTEPGLRPSGPGGPPSTSAPSAGSKGSGEAALAAEQRAQQNFDKSMRDYYQQINDWIGAKSANPGMGANERQVYDRMVRNAERSAAEAGQELQSATNAAKPYKQAQPTGLPPCPPNCGNDRATMDGANQLQQSGLGMSFWKITWPQ
jgi:hypothetical protein